VTLPVPVYTHPDCPLHDPGAGHPESPARIGAVLERLAAEPQAEVRFAAAASREAVRRVHPDRYLDSLESLARAGGGAADSDTILNTSSWTAALGGAGAALAAADAAMAGAHAFAAIRPPGHHALRAMAMGFCLLANAVIAARHAQAAGRARVLIVDWDVHHGNGTQALVQDDPTVRFVSLHQWPHYPGTGAADERGVGNVFNVPRPPGLSRERYVGDLWDATERATEGWQPDFIVISAGYDAMRGDPLGGFTLEPDDFAEIVMRLRERMPGIPIAAVMEGGYVPRRLAEGVVATVTALA
jgi:acetoin utilization deacetylase AcuC-like enzyme